MLDTTTAPEGAEPEGSRPRRLSRSGWLAGALLLVGLAATLAPERQLSPAPVLMKIDRVDTPQGPIGLRLSVIGPTNPGPAAYDRAASQCACAVYLTGQVSFMLEVENRTPSPLARSRLYPHLLEIQLVVPAEEPLERVIDVPALREKPPARFPLEVDLTEESGGSIAPGEVWSIPLYFPYEGNRGDRSVEFLARDEVSVDARVPVQVSDGYTEQVVTSAPLVLPRQRLTWTPVSARTAFGLAVAVTAGRYLVRDVRRRSP